MNYYFHKFIFTEAFEMELTHSILLTFGNPSNLHKQHLKSTNYFLTAALSNVQKDKNTKSFLNCSHFQNDTLCTVSIKKTA